MYTLIVYKDLPHPPASYLSLPATGVIPNPAATAPPNSYTTLSRPKYAARSADGTEYNPLFPRMGMAGSPYARTVSSSHTYSQQALPDAGLVFDTLLKRPTSAGGKASFTEHPGGINSLFFAFADLVIHSCFNTSHRDWTINEASSYLDLSPLYGSSEQDLEKVRKNDGTGKLWEDVFADSRILFMPPAVCALLVLFCRNHNVRLAGSQIPFKY